MNNDHLGIELAAEEAKLPEEARIEPAMDLKNTLILNKIIKWCIYIFVFLLPLWFLPFTSEVLNLNKQALMIGLLTVALIAWLGELITKERVVWYKGLLILFFLGFVIIYGLSTVFSLRPYHSLMGADANLAKAFINIIYFFIFFLLMVNYQSEEAKKRNAQLLQFLFVFLASSTIAGIFGVVQLLGKFIFPWDFAKLNSFNVIGTPTSLGIFLVVLLPIAFSLLFSLKSEKKEKVITAGLKVLLVTLAILGLIVLLLLNFRILWLIAAIGMIIVISFRLARRHTIPASNLSWLAIPVIILAFSLIFLLFKPGNLFDVNLPLEVGLSPSGSWNVVKEAVKNNPILGSGPETFTYNYSSYKPKAINQTIFWNIRFAHANSEILSLLSEIGVLGILAFLALIGFFLFTKIKKIIGPAQEKDQLAEIKTGLLASWLILFIAWFLYPQSLALIFVFWLLFTLSVVLDAEKKDFKMINLKTSNKIALATSFGFIILMVLIVGLLYLTGSKFIAEINYKTGLDLTDKGRLDDGINKVLSATVTNPYEDKFYRDLAQLFLTQINQTLYRQDLTQDEQSNKIQLGINSAINSANRATVLDSKNVSNWIIRGAIYRNLMSLVSDTGKWAIYSYEEALKLEPRNPFIQLEIGRTYVAGANLLSDQEQQNQQAINQAADYLNKAVEAYNKAIEFKSDYSPAHFELAIVYDRQGKIKEAITGMENSKMLNPRDTGIAFQLGVLYYKNSQFDKAKSEFMRAVNLDTNYSNARYFLGLLLDREDKKEEAIDQFERIEELNPDNQLIKQILANLRAGEPALGAALEIPEQPQEIPIEEKQPEKLDAKLPGE